jgi:polysaccharide biosynthesis/export protein VpsN
MNFLGGFSRGKAVLASFIIVASGLLAGCQTSQPAYSAPPAMNEQGDNPPIGQQASTGSVLVSERSDFFTVGDTVTVTFSGVQDPPLKHEEEVKGDGTITITLIGSVKADHKTPGDLQKEIYAAFVPKYYTANSGFNVTVQPKERVFYVGGEVKIEGPKVYLGKTTLTKAIQAAGGFTDYANKRSVKLIRADGTTSTVNWNKANDNPTLDPSIFPGDKIHVKRRIF